MLFKTRINSGTLHRVIGEVLVLGLLVVVYKITYSSCVVYKIPYSRCIGPTPQRVGWTVTGPSLAGRLHGLGFC